MVSILWQQAKLQCQQPDARADTKHHTAAGPGFLEVSMSDGYGYALMHVHISGLMHVYIPGPA